MLIFPTSVKLSSVIVNWNSGSCLPRLLEALEDIPLEKNVVVDNASTDKSVAEVRRFESVQLIESSTNRGFAAAANLGISQTASPWILLLNPDIQVTAETVLSLYESVCSRADVAIACPALQNPEGTSQSAFQIRNLPRFRDVVADVLFFDELLGRRPTGRLEPTVDSGVFQVEQPAAAFWFLSRRVWHDLGGFDESFFPAWFEDVDFCRRLQPSQWQILFFSELAAVHEGGIALKHLSRNEFYRIYYGNLLRYWRKHHRRSWPLIWLPIKLGIGLRKVLRKA